MKVLLVSMPQATSSLQAVLPVPNLSICSLAGNLDKCDTRCLDLSLYRGRITPLLQHIMQAFSPDLVGMTALSHQYDSARRVALVCKTVKPQVLTALAGRHVTALAEEIAESDDRELFDFMIRGEGELIFNELTRELAKDNPLASSIKGLSYLTGDGYIHNSPARLPEMKQIRKPDRDCRIVHGPRFDMPFAEAVETSREGGVRRKGKPEMRFFSLERVMEDLARIVERGTGAAFFVDDDLAVDPERLKELCRQIESSKLLALSSVMRMRVGGIAGDDELPGLLAKANVHHIILNLGHSEMEGSLQMDPCVGDRERARIVVKALHAAGIAVIGELTVGGPEDTRKTIHQTWRYARDLDLDHAVVRILTPHPKTAIRERLMAEGLVTNINDYSRYNGFLANVRTRHLTSPEILRWLVFYGSRFYFSPRHLLRSRLWWRRTPGAIAMLALDVRFLFSGLRGNLFVLPPLW
jgi:radical SAM superfamily enzyme YgiQ (UPF0313 family)